MDHKENSKKIIEKIQKLLSLANASFEATAAQFRVLANKEISSKDLEKYVKIVFATKKQQEEADSIEEMTSGRRVMEDIKNLFETGRGADLPGVRGTYWGAYNAISEYVQYSRGSDAGNRLDSTWFGTGMQINKKALQTAITLAI